MTVLLLCGHSVEPYTLKGDIGDDAFVKFRGLFRLFFYEILLLLW